MIALLTDFGQSEYVGVMKGVICSINADAKVVDPAVGTPRKAIAVTTINYYFVAPDNGLLWATLQEQRIVQIRQITVPKWSSRIFHGRDVFAPAAASIGLGRFDKLGPLLNQIKKLDLYRKGREGMVVRIDGFGSVITNLPKGNKRAYSVRIADKTYRMCFCPVWSRAGLKLRRGGFARSRRMVTSENEASSCIPLCLRRIGEGAQDTPYRALRGRNGAVWAVFGGFPAGANRRCGIFRPLIYDD